MNIEDCTNALQQTAKHAEDTIEVTFNGKQFLDLDRFYYSEAADLHDVSDMSGELVITGNVQATFGRILITKYKDRLLAYDLRKYFGYKARVLKSEIDINLPDQQMALF